MLIKRPWIRALSRRTSVRAFRSGLIKGLALGLPWAACGRVGSVAAVYVLETKGPQAHSYALSEFVERYVAAFGEDEATSALRAELA